MALKKRHPESETHVQKKRRRCFKHNFKVNEEVEVTTFDEGLKGSWLPATVTATFQTGHIVRYKNNSVLTGDTDNSDNLVEFFHIDRSRLMRPLPPFVEIGNGSLFCGQCVDVYHNGLWWEAVIFNYIDDRKHAIVFFPEIGEVLRIGIDKLRITQDWDKGLGQWKRRGKWVFLQLVEELVEEGWYVPVSIRQIWDDVRLKIKNGFEKTENWASVERDLCKGLMMEVINEYLGLVLKDLEKKMEL